jgi:glucuronate isomerase
MKAFMDENFLLSNDTAVKLYHDFAKEMPIYDYHCHISPKEIWENKKFKNITEVWLYGDHYKWRAMRSFGIEEKFITGDASDYDKFMAWAKVIPYTIGNPLYHWTHLELQRFFGIKETLSPKTAEAIWNKANEMLQTEDFTVRKLIERSNVKGLCTTDDPVDTLEYHEKIKADKTFNVKVFPAFRPDKFVEINRDTFLPWIEKLGNITNTKVDSLDVLLSKLEERVDFFHANDCRLADHALDTVPYAEATKEEVAEIFKKVLKEGSVDKAEQEKYRTFMVTFFGKLYHARGWVMQFHISAMRDNNTRMYKKLGADTGFDAIQDEVVSYPLSRLLDSLAGDDKLPKTILYTLNPKDNYTLGTLLGCFQSSDAKGKIQFGSGWWFNDQRDGMTEQMKSLANLGLLSQFVGMLTDSRSFLSYTRHEYFRRVLCNLLGQWIENGEYPADMDILKEIVQGICFNNAKRYFGVDI